MTLPPLLPPTLVPAPMSRLLAKAAFGGKTNAVDPAALKVAAPLKVGAGGMTDSSGIEDEQAAIGSDASDIGGGIRLGVVLVLNP